MFAKILNTLNNTCLRNVTTVVDHHCIRKIILDFPKNKNSLSLDMLNSLISDTQNAALNTNIKVIIMSSSQPNIFSSGHDLKQFQKNKNDNDLQLQKEILEKLVRLINIIQNLPIPVIAEIKGHAAAAGCQLACSCDIITASEKALFSTPGIKQGIFCSTPGVAIIKSSLPLKIATKMLFTGDPITAQEAYQFGLVSQVFPEHLLEDGTVELANKIAKNSKEVLSLGKQCLYQQINLDKEKAYQVAIDAMLENIKLDDAQEGIKAFLEKRTPIW
ncbi:unnamed protein product [Gordionus sp. m RMFG-2023]